MRVIRGGESNDSVEGGSVLCEVQPLTSRSAVPLYIFQIFLSRRSMPFPGCYRKKEGRGNREGREREGMGGIKVNC